MNHISNVLWNSIRRLTTECDASAASEYAILLALLVLGVLGAVSILGITSNGLFHSAVNEAANSSGGNMSGPSNNGFGTVVKTQVAR
ncbi:MAG: hypothetical protein HY287_03430 [Planctomycetes bacterium]|nr:hypothetical protein [Planctomycetota bacterium]MBI3833363.1 hypothetical protein [Planctomycetota bacterium]